jgi:hypothetical protein
VLRIFLLKRNNRFLFFVLGFQVEKIRCVGKHASKNIFLILNQTDYGRQIHFIFCLHPFLKNYVQNKVKCQQLKCFGIIPDKQIESVSDVEKAQHLLIEKLEVNPFVHNFSYEKENVDRLPCLLKSFPLAHQNKSEEYCFIKNINIKTKSTSLLENVCVQELYGNGVYVRVLFRMEYNVEKSRNFSNLDLVAKIEKWIMTFEERLQCFLKLCCVMQNVILKSNEKSLQKCSFVNSKEWKISGEEILCSRLPVKKCLRKSLLSKQSSLYPNLLVSGNVEREPSLKCLETTRKHSLPTCDPEVKLTLCFFFILDA